MRTGYKVSLSLVGWWGGEEAHEPFELRFGFDLKFKPKTGSWQMKALSGFKDGVPLFLCGLV